MTVFEVYLEHLNNTGKSKKTIMTYFNELRLFLRFIEERYQLKQSPEDMAKMRGYMLDAYYASIKYKAPRSRNTSVVAIKSFCKFLLNSQYIDSDPSSILKIIYVAAEKYEEHPDDRTDCITKEDALRLLSAESASFAKRNRAMIALILGTGLRVFELCELNVGTLRNMRNGMIYCHRKYDKWRWAPLPYVSLAYINEYLETRGGIDNLKDEEPLFITKKRRRMAIRTAQRAIVGLQKSLGIPTGLHIMRHTVLTEVEKIGGEAVARDTASHTNLRTTNLYLHSSAKDRVEAANKLPWLVAASQNMSAPPKS